MRLRDHLDRAHNRLFLLRMVEESAIPHRHLAHEIARLIVAHAVPFLARVALGQLIGPAPDRRFGLEQPVSHQITFFHGISSTPENSSALASGSLLAQSCAASISSTSSITSEP